MATPATKSYNFLKRMGFKVESASVLTSDGNVKRDLFGLFNVIAIQPHRGLTLAAWAVADNVVAGAAQKVMESRWSGFLLSAKWIIEVHGWQSGILDPRIVRFTTQRGKVVMV